MSDEDVVDDLLKRADKIRSDMGGPDKLERMAAEGDKTIRQHIDGILDPGSFSEIGTFSRSIREHDRDRTPGDGKIGSFGLRPHFASFATAKLGKRAERATHSAWPGRR